MLESYELKGFKCIKNTQKVDLKATNYKILVKQNVIYNGLLKGAMFVGENGIGKSTMIGSVKLLLDLLFSKEQIDLRNYFCLTNTSEKHIELEYHFLSLGERVKYVIDIRYEKPLNIKELLWINDDLIIERKGDQGHFKNENNPINASNIEPTRLFLRDLCENNLVNGNKILNNLIKELNNSAYLNGADLKLINYNEEFTRMSANSLEGQVVAMNKCFQALDIKAKLQIKVDQNNKYSLRLLKDGESVALPVSFESTGLKYLVKILPSVLNIMENGGLCIIDELGVLHPELAAKLIKYFNENTKTAQLLIASDATTLLNMNCLRADQLYNVYKDGKDLKLCRFSSKQPRELQNMEKMYYNGTFR